MKKAGGLAGYRLVLVGPLYGGNVGACARLAANYDLRDLWIVRPRPGWRGREARLYAKGPAADYLERFKEVDELEQALEGCSAAVGFTRRSGELRSSTVELAEIAELGTGKKSEVALVFGREDSGLTRDELLLCTHVCSFAVEPIMPSLNLSHAVAVALSAVYSRPRPEAVSEPVANVDELEELFTHWRAAMVDAGMVKGGNPEKMLVHVRRVLQRARLTPRELAMFRAYLSKTQVMMGTRKRGRPPA